MNKFQIKNQKDFEDCLMWISDLYKDVYGIRPRGYDFHKYTFKKLETYVNELLYISQEQEDHQNSIEEKAIEDVNIGEEVMTVVIPNLPDEDLGYGIWKTWSSTDDMSNLEVSTATIKNMFFDYKDGYYNINDGLLKVTNEHPLWGYRDNKWSWYTLEELLVGDKLLNYKGETIEVTKLEFVEGEVEVVNIDVEPLDVYFAGGILVHNKGTDSDPEG